MPRRLDSDESAAAAAAPKAGRAGRMRWRHPNGRHSRTGGQHAGIGVDRCAPTREAATPPTPRDPGGGRRIRRRARLRGQPPARPPRTRGRRRRCRAARARSGRFFGDCPPRRAASSGAVRDTPIPGPLTIRTSCDRAPGWLCRCPWSRQLGRMTTPSRLCRPARARLVTARGRAQLRSPEATRRAGGWALGVSRWDSELVRRRWGRQGGTVTKGARRPCGRRAPGGEASGHPKRPET